MQEVQLAGRAANFCVCEQLVSKLPARAAEISPDSSGYAVVGVLGSDFNGPQHFQKFLEVFIHMRGSLKSASLSGFDLST